MAHSSEITVPHDDTPCAHRPELEVEAVEETSLLFLIGDDLVVYILTYVEVPTLVGLFGVISKRAHGLIRWLTRQLLIM